MSSRFTHKEIAHQAGLSLATVDSVLHGRAHVSLATKDRLHAALQELEQQYAVSPLRQTRVTLDIVMQAPERFSSAVRAAAGLAATAFVTAFGWAGGAAAWRLAP